MHDASSAFLYTSVQARWDAARREEALVPLLAPAKPSRPVWPARLLVLVGKRLIRLGCWLVNGASDRSVRSLAGRSSS
ncbi:MAG: hypothetical protein ACOYYS_22355 [Chloroflexota bacterium]